MDNKNVKSVYEKLQNVRVEINNSMIKKGGLNEYDGFSYFELTDFLPKANELFLKHEITPAFDITEDMASITIYDWSSDKTIYFSTPIASAVVYKRDGKPKNLPIQDLGSTHTYLKRYLYLHVLELSEVDDLDANAGNPDNETRKPAPKPVLANAEQVKEINDIMDNDTIARMLTAYKVDKVGDIPQETLADILTIQRKKVADKKADNKKVADKLPTLNEI